MVDVVSKADAQACTNFQSRIRAYQSLGKSVTYIGESGFDHDNPRTHGYRTKGQRCGAE